ncbi:MAG: ammonium transporter [Bacillota bacterium]
MNGIDSVFVFLSTVLVFIMTPALALFYGGMVRSKNVLSTTMHSYAMFAIVSVQWVAVGYSLAFGNNLDGLLGSLIGGGQYAFMNGVGFDPSSVYGTTIPHSLFFMFQLMFAIITPALISGGFAERIKFKSFLVFIILWCFLVYDPIAHWVWGANGWLYKLGALDFAGGNVVHISSGVTALVAALVLGKRKNKSSARPHNIPLTILGAGILVFGWYGFNAGSALAFNGVAMNAFITTNTAAACGMIGWVAFEWIRTKKPTALGAVSGIVAGLVAITPAAGFVNVQGSMAIGLLGGTICYFAVSILKKKFGYDDALDAFGCHGIGGTVGGLATGLFATVSVNAAGADGFFYSGNFSLLGKQAIAIIVTYALAGGISFILLKVIDKVMGLRSSEEAEATGLDVADHGEEAYSGIAS